MKAILSKLMSTSGVVIGPFILFPLFYIISALCFGYKGNYGLFLMFLSCLLILPSNKVLMFEASMPGKREKSIDARYVLALIIIIFYTVLMSLIGLDGKGGDLFGFEIFLSVLFLSIEYPVIFLSSEKIHGITTAVIAALLILALYITHNYWTQGNCGNFVIWVALGIVLFAVSRTITVKLFLKKGITN